NTVYFRYLEQARISWFEHMGLPPDPSGMGPVIVNAHCSFVRQLEYPGTVLCRCYVGAIGRASFETSADLSRTDDPDTVYAHGGAKVVWVDFPAKKSAPLPPEIRSAIVRPWGGQEGVARIPG
ncbi:thioesterase family protein, partial [Devosia sp.]|uniref:acyl-CoA thioesterase n=1 Tax=Devosia sp. TaxID=1871048 RepID=UPI001A108E26